MTRSVSPKSFYEIEYERLFRQASPILFPQYVVAPFKTSVSSEEGTAKPDLALIEKKYREWWVIEVELDHHSLHTHVLPQVRLLARATYGSKEAEMLYQAKPALDLQQLKEMMKGKQPRVMVVLNRFDDKWTQELSRYDAILAVFEVFISQRNEFAYRLNGEVPEPIGEAISQCTFDPLIPRFLLVESPASLTVGPNEKVEIYHEGERSLWQRIDSVDRVWLSPLGPNPLDRKRKYCLSLQEDNSLTLKPIK